MIFTIGHSTHPIERFVALLRQHHIAVLADVRSTPFSRFNPQFNRAALTNSLAAVGIRYEFLGEELGARSSDPDCFVEGRVSYARLARTAGFRHGIARLRTEEAGQRIAIMCAEREPLDCHRTILVARELEREGVEIAHILADGSLEENRHAIGRLITHLGLAMEDLFRDPAQLAEEAYEAQGRRIAYVPKGGKAPAARAGRRKPATR